MSRVRAMLLYGMYRYVSMLDIRWDNGLELLSIRHCMVRYDNGDSTFELVELFRS